MKIYHGTNGIFKEDILKNGLKPRGENIGNWEEYPSRIDCVYLTAAYPFYFAINTDADFDELLVIEIDTDKLDQSLILPDEDLIGQIRNSAGEEKMSSETHAVVRQELENYIVGLNDKDTLTLGEREPDKPATAEEIESTWKTSIKVIGNCCYKGAIPPAAFTRYCTVKSSQRPIPLCMAINASPRILYKNKADHEKLTQWFFGDSTLPRFKPFKAMREYFSDVKVLKNHFRSKEFHRLHTIESKNRKGIKVVDLTK